MSAETLIYSTLSGAAGVTAIVALRIHPDFLAQEISLPAIVNQRADSEYINTIHSGLPVAIKVTMDTFCLASTRIGAETLADAVEVALPAGGFRVSGRRPEFDAETLTFAAIITSEVWP